MQTLICIECPEPVVIQSLQTSVCSKCHEIKDVSKFKRGTCRSRINKSCNECASIVMNLCSHCHIKRHINDFFDDGKEYKTCIHCRQTPKQLCIHGRQRQVCKDCGGSQICEHNRQRHNCKDCGGSQICEHNRRRQFCKECGGSQICEHNRKKSSCKECGGSQICEHNRIKYVCRDCNGVSICIHNRYKPMCKECKGSQICEHNRVKQICKDCDGASICEHNKKRNECKDCDGASICEHGVIRRVCVRCDGVGLCEHKRQRYHCKDCGGNGICEHKKSKFTCLICNPEKACKYCNSAYVHIQSRYHPFCFMCYCVLHPDEKIPRRFHIKETYLREEIQKKFSDLNIIFNRKIDNGCSNRRPDIFIECFTHTIIIECDENQHSGYSCENKRIMEIFQDLGNRPLVLIRFNPDAYIEESKKIPSPFKYTKSGLLSLNKPEWKWRIKELNRAIFNNLSIIPTKEITIIHLFYSD